MVSPFNLFYYPKFINVLTNLVLFLRYLAWYCYTCDLALEENKNSNEDYKNKGKRHASRLKSLNNRKIFSPSIDLYKICL